MGDFIYAFSSEGVTVTNYSTMNLSASIGLPERVEVPNYWDDVVYLEIDEEREERKDDDGDSASSGSSEQSPEPDRE